MGSFLVSSNSFDKPNPYNPDRSLASASGRQGTLPQLPLDVMAIIVGISSPDTQKIFFDAFTKLRDPFFKRISLHETLNTIGDEWVTPEKLIPFNDIDSLHPFKLSLPTQKSLIQLTDLFTRFPKITAINYQNQSQIAIKTIFQLINKKFLSSIKEMNLSMSRVHGELHLLPKELKHLDLSHTNVTNSDIETLSKQAPHLESLDISFTSINNDCAQHLAKFENLKKFHALDTMITDEGFNHLSPGIKNLHLPNHTVLNNLKRLVQRFSNLRELYLPTTLSDDLNTHNFANALNKLSELEVLKLPFNTPNEIFSKLPSNIKKISISQCYAITEQALESGLKRLPLIEKISLKSRPVSDLTLINLPQGLKDLELENCSLLTDDGVQSALKRFVNLKLFCFCNHSINLPAAIAILPPSIKELIFISTNITAESLHLLNNPYRFPKLKILTLKNHATIKREDIQILTRAKKISQMSTNSFVVNF